MKSAPSRATFELMERWPLITRPKRSDSCTTAGVSCANSAKLRPRTGSSLMARSSMVVAVTADRVSRLADAVTVTASVTPPTERASSSSSVRPTVTVRPVRRVGAKPWSVAVRS